MFKSLAFALAFSCATAAGAVTIPVSAKVAGVQTGPGTGLAGTFYNQSISDPIAAHAPGALGAADGTFHTTTFDYCCGTDAYESVTDFLGNDGASFVGTDPGTMDSSVFVFNGFINITDDLNFGPASAEGGINFDIGVCSDDGFDLTIGGVSVGAAGDRGYECSYLPVNFAEAGLYSFSMLYYEQGGYNGLYVGRFMGEGVMGFDADRFFLTAPDEGNTDVPEPAMLGLFGLGALGLGVARHRRR